VSARDTTPKRLSTRFQRRTIVGMAGRTARAALVSSDQEKPDQGEKAPSGRLLLRMPRTLHAELARAAEREGTSLNGFITGALASTIGWRGEDGEPGMGSAARTNAPATRQTRLLLVVLVANAVVVGLAALAALGVLLVAWLG